MTNVLTYISDILFINYDINDKQIAVFCLAVNNFGSYIYCLHIFFFAFIKAILVTKWAIFIEFLKSLNYFFPN